MAAERPAHSESASTMASLLDPSPSPAQGLVLLVILLAIFRLDYHTGPFLEVGLFYNIVIILGCVQFGRSGLLFVLLAMAGYLFCSISFDGVGGYEFRPVNAWVRAGSFSLVAVVSLMLHEARKRMQANQRQLEADVYELGAVLQCLPEAVLSLEPDLRVRTVGGQLLAQLGHRPEQACGPSLTDLPVAPELAGYLRDFAARPSAHPPLRLPVGDRVLEAAPAQVAHGPKVPSGWVLVVRDVTEQVRANELLLSRARSMAVQETRGGLARHLHDHVAQTLASMRMRLDLLAMEEDPRARRGLLETVRAALGQAIRDVRQTMWELRPTALERLPFLQAVQTYLEDLQAHSGFRVELSMEGSVQLAPDREVLVFYIIQEAVANALKHSGAAGVCVRLRSQEDALIVEVEDPGSGFDPALVEADPLRKSFGLRDMRDRARLLGATLALEKGSQGGTCVRLSVPRESPREESA